MRSTKESRHFSNENLPINSAIGLFFISTIYLYGTQTINEYDHTRLQRVKRNVKINPNFYIDNPIILCLLPDNNETTVVIIDGHHRVRSAPKFDIVHIPALIYTLEAISQIKGRPVESLEMEYRRDLALTVEDFSQRIGYSYAMPVKLPLTIDAITNMSGNEFPQGIKPILRYPKQNRQSSVAV